MHLFNAFDLFKSFLIIMDFRFWMSIQYQVFNTSTLQSRTADWLIIDQICRRKLHPKKPWELWHLRMMWWCSSFFLEFRRIFKAATEEQGVTLLNIDQGRVLNISNNILCEMPKWIVFENKSWNEGKILTWYQMNQLVIISLNLSNKRLHDNEWILIQIRLLTASLVKMLGTGWCDRGRGHI